MDTFLAMFIYGVLLLMGVVAIGKGIQLKRQGASLDRAITEGIFRAWEWVQKQLQGFEQLMMKSLYVFAVLALFLLFILWGLSRL